MLATTAELGKRIRIPEQEHRASTAFPRMTIIHLRESVAWVDTKAGKAEFFQYIGRPQPADR